jgi:hypothetical protein
MKKIEIPHCMVSLVDPAEKNINLNIVPTKTAPPRTPPLN